MHILHKLCLARERGHALTITREQIEQPGMKVEWRARFGGSNNLAFDIEAPCRSQMESLKDATEAWSAFLGIRTGNTR